jgi:hypothetical protein
MDCHALVHRGDVARRTNMVMPSSLYATISSQDGNMLANRVEAQEREIVDADGVHHVIIVLLTQNQAAKMTIGTSYLIKFGMTKSNAGAYTLIRREDERLPLRRHTFRSDVRI